jgi:hypothetical protein
MADRQIIGTGTGIHASRALGISAILVAAGLSGCAGQPVQMGSTVKNVPVEQALVMPPPSGPGIVSVVERRYDNAVDQDIHLYTSAITPGQNMLKVQLFGTTAPYRMASNTLTSTPVTESGVISEMRKVLPGVRMSRSRLYVQNSYGPFGYAFGQGQGSDLCMYGWQQVRSPSGTMSPFANYGSIQIRLRVCEAGATEQKLLALMYNFTIVGAVDAGGWNPYGEVNPVAPTLGGIGAPTYPRSIGTEPMVPAAPQRQSIMMQRSPTVISSVAVQRSTPKAPAAEASAETAAPLAASPRVPSPVLDPASGSAPVAASPLVVPSPTTQQATSRVVVPSPSCATQKEGQDAACR